MSKTKTNKRATNSIASLLVSKNTPQEVETKNKEAMFNLVNFVETLIKMDRQQQEWKKNNNNKENTNGK
jgi:hypothetical protein